MAAPEKISFHSVKVLSCPRTYTHRHTHAHSNTHMANRGVVNKVYKTYFSDQGDGSVDKVLATQGPEFKSPVPM